MPADQPLTDWLVHVTPDVSIRLADIYGDEWAPVEAETGDDWLLLASNPLGGPSKRMLAVYRLACQKAGVESKRLTSQELWAAFENVPDDRPTSYRDGLPDPKVDDLATGSSSGS